MACGLWNTLCGGPAWGLGVILVRWCHTVAEWGLQNRSANELGADTDHEAAIVWEWCWDSWSEYRAPSRVLGAARSTSYAIFCTVPRLTRILCYTPTIRDISIGFRLARSARMMSASFSLQPEKKMERKKGTPKKGQANFHVLQANAPPPLSTAGASKARTAPQGPSGVFVTASSSAPTLGGARSGRFQDAEMEPSLPAQRARTPRLSFRSIGESHSISACIPVSTATMGPENRERPDHRFNVGAQGKFGRSRLSLAERVGGVM